MGSEMCIRDSMQCARILRLQDEIVPDVLERLRDVARREAELLFREHRNHPAMPLPFISERISNAINSVTDAALRILDDASAGVSGVFH